MKKICLLVLSLLMMVAGASALVACGGGEEEVTYAIDAAFTFADAELGETYKPDLSGAKVVGSDGTESDLKVTIKGNEYTRPDGTTGTLLAGQFRADQLGNYTVVLTASDETVADVTKTIAVKDTVGPTVSPGNIADLPTTALIGQTVTVPTLFTAQDAGKLVGEVEVGVLDPDGKEVTLENNTFKPAMAGDYTIVATQSDESGNEGRYEAKVNVYNAQFDPAVAAYFSSEYGMVQGGAWPGHEAYIAESFVADVTDQGEASIAAAPDGTKAATKITGATGGRFTYYVNMAQTDLSGYDYIGMWIYNDSDLDCIFELASPAGTGVNVNHFRFPANAWSFWAINLTVDGVQIPAASTGLYEVNEVSQFAFYVTQEGKALQEWTLGDSLYFTDFALGSFEDDKLASYDQPFGAANLTQFGAEVNVANVTYSTETKQDGTDGSLKVTFTADTCTTYNLKMYGFNDITADNAGETYYLWVYNPNDYAIRFYGGDTAAQDIAANSGGYVKITIKANGGHNMGVNAAWQTNVMPAAGNGATFGIGDCFYIGALYREAPADVPEEPDEPDPGPDPENRVAAAFSSEAGMEQGDAWPGGHDVYISESFVADVTQQGEASIAAAPDGTKSATKVTGATGGRFTYCIQMAKTDLTGYDYIGMWIYNDSDIDCIFELGAGGGSGVNVNHFRFPANAWSYWVINLTVDGIKLPGTSKMYELDDVQELAFYVTQVGKDMKEWTKGDSLYFTDFILGNFEDDKLASYDQPFGAANLTQFGAEVNVANVTYSTETKQDGTDGSLKVTFTADTCTTYNLKMYGFNDITADNAGETYYLWVYNPNDYAIRFYGGDTAAQDIAANSGGYVKITIKANGGHNMGVNAAWQTNVMPAAGNGATFGIGDCFYIGALYRVAPSDVSGAEQA